MQIQTQQSHDARKRNGHAVRETELVLAPPVDVLENEQEILIVVDLPGVAAGDVDVALDGGQLTFEGRRDGRTPTRLRRAFSVPPSVDPDRISATLEDGVLTVRLGKRDEVKPRRIEVRSAG